MKKSIIMLSAMTILAFTSCDDKKENVDTTEEVITVDDETTQDTTVIEDSVDENDTNVEVTTTDVVDTPDFDNPELQSYITSYDAYIKEYQDAMISQDASSIQALTAKGQELGNKAQAFTDLSESDAKKLGDYMQLKAKEMQEIAMKAAGQ